MPRRPRFCPAGMPVHVVQRGNNRQVWFAKEVDIAAHANWLGEYAKKFDVEVHGWVFMTNHVHLLLTPKDETGVSKLMQTLGRLCVRYLNMVISELGRCLKGATNKVLFNKRNIF
ncbi:MAG: putative transposase [Candidatus Azotimanducaceae bacterium]|jgi:putative transposase